MIPTDNGPAGREVVLCSDKGVNQTMMDHTMAHELIHAYDQCRVKLERSNCLHVACTEVGILLRRVCLVCCMWSTAELRRHRELLTRYWFFALQSKKKCSSEVAFMFHCVLYRLLTQRRTDVQELLTDVGPRRPASRRHVRVGLTTEIWERATDIAGPPPCSREYVCVCVLFKYP